MRQVVREHTSACGIVAGSLQSYAALVMQQQRDTVEEILYRPDWAMEGEGDVLFTAGRQAGQTQGKQAFEMRDLAQIEALGRIAGWTSKRHPRTYQWIYAEKDAANGRMTGDAWCAFVTGWRQTGGDRRRVKGV